MAVIDDEFLGQLLHDAGGAFPVPATGAADILHRATHPDDDRADPAQIAFDLGEVAAPPTRTTSGTVRRTIRSHRLLSVAAALVIVMAIAASAVLLGNKKTPTVTAGLGARAHTPAAPPSASALPGTTPSTTLPAGSFGTGTSGTTGTNAAAGAPSLGASAQAPQVTPSAAASTPASTIPTNDAIGQPARIEQTGSLDLTVAKGSLANTITKLSFYADALDGFVANSQTQSANGANGSPSGSVTLQVPVASFSSMLKEAQSLGRTSQLTTKATDVTGQYVDLQAQITALEASRQQYLTIMAKATSIGDILSVQAQLDTLQQQIQQLQGQLQVLSSETTYSTLTVLVSESTSGHHHPAPHPPSGVDKAWHDSVHGFLDGVDGLIRIAGPILFGLLCLGALLLAIRLSWRRLQRHNL